MIRSIGSIKLSTRMLYLSGLVSLLIPQLLQYVTMQSFSVLLSAAVGSDESPNVILVDDNKTILSDEVAVLEEVLLVAAITGFIWPQEAIEYAKRTQVALAILDIELGTASGLDLSRALLEINPLTNIVFLTAYPDYSLDAWEPEASGFIVKPLTPERMKKQLVKLRHPLQAGGESH